MGGEARYLDTTDRPALQVVDYDDPSMYYIQIKIYVDLKYQLYHNKWNMSEF